MDPMLASVLGFVVGMLLMFLLMSVGSKGRLERKLDLMLQHSGIDVTATAAVEARKLMEAGKKIEAIKVYRELTGCGLAEAKSRVEMLQ